MSYYAVIDGEDSGDVATNSGWHEFSTWLQELGTPAAKKLSEEGEADVSALLQELDKKTPETDTAASTLGNFLSMLRGKSGVVTITDGVG